MVFRSDRRFLDVLCANSRNCGLAVELTPFLETSYASLREGSARSDLETSNYRTFRVEHERVLWYVCALAAPAARLPLSPLAQGLTTEVRPRDAALQATPLASTPLAHSSRSLLLRIRLWRRARPHLPQEQSWRSERGVKPRPAIASQYSAPLGSPRLPSAPLGSSRLLSVQAPVASGGRLSATRPPPPIRSCTLHSRTAHSCTLHTRGCHLPPLQPREAARAAGPLPLPLGLRAECTNVRAPRVSTTGRKTVRTAEHSGRQRSTC